MKKQSPLAVAADMLKAAAVGPDSDVSGSKVHVWNSGDVCPLTRGLSGFGVQEAPHVNKDSTPITVFSPLLHADGPVYGRG
jgi:hypothetical protein